MTLSMNQLPIIGNEPAGGPTILAAEGDAPAQTAKGTYCFVSLGCPKNLIDSEKMLNIESEEPFTVFALEYLNNDKSRLWTQSVKEKGSVIQIPIADAGLLEIIKYGPWLNTYDRSATIWFRVHVEKDGHKKICEMSATIKSELKGSTMRRRVIG